MSTSESYPYRRSTSPRFTEWCRVLYGPTGCTIGLSALLWICLPIQPVVSSIAHLDVARQPYLYGYDTPCHISIFYQPNKYVLSVFSLSSSPAARTIVSTRFFWHSFASGQSSLRLHPILIYLPDRPPFSLHSPVSPSHPSPPSALRPPLHLLSQFLLPLVQLEYDHVRGWSNALFILYGCRLIQSLAFSWLSGWRSSPHPEWNWIPLRV